MPCFMTFQVATLDSTLTCFVNCLCISLCAVHVRVGSKAALSAPKPDFRVTPINVPRPAGAACLFYPQEQTLTGRTVRSA